VRAQGIVSRAATFSLAPMLQSIPDLHARLSAPGARFLDVGAGAAGLGIAYATLYPTLQVVGLEPSEVACAEARRAIDDAGLADRIEIRHAFGQELDESATFTAAYVAQMFIPDDAVDGVWRATARALAPGGWLTTATIAIDGADLAASLARFRSAIWGGGVRRAPAVLEALERAGFTELRAIQGPGMVPILARRAL
jgi:precorrin-6B methylase 2